MKLGREDDQQGDRAVCVHQREQVSDHRELQHCRDRVGEKQHDDADQHGYRP
jgi:hypothetical protein